eukprot:Sdes_comp19377_c0_seq3m10648
MVSMETDVVATYSSNPVDISARATPSSGLSQTLLVNNIFSDQLLSSSYRASSAHSGQDDIYCLFREKTLDVVKKSEFLAVSPLFPSSLPPVHLRLDAHLPTFSVAGIKLY